MPIQFVGEGRVGQPLRKKKVLSNKALTRRVRALSGQEGQRTSTVGAIFSAVTLTAGTADINYITGINGLTDDLLHRCKFYIHAVALADSTLRIILFEDNEPDVADLTVTGILSSESAFTNITSADMQPWGAGRKAKNIEASPRRTRILRDILVPQTLTDKSERYMRILDVNFYGRRKTVENFDLGFLVLSTAATVVDITFNLDHTDLNI